MHAVKRQFAIVVLLALFSTTWSPIVHAYEKHIHDGSCSVYVLEQFFLATDEIPSTLIAPLFIAFIYFVHLAPLKSAPLLTFARVRAPPSC